jgi:hypothetical protein
MMRLSYFASGYYTWKTRIQPEGIKAFLFHSYGYIVSCLPLLAQAILESSILSTIRNLLFGFVLLYSFYEVLYVINDFVAVKYEALPTYRAQGIQIKLAYFVFVRGVYIIMFLRILSLYVKNLWEIIYVLISILVIGIMHNFNTDKFLRHPTHATLRILRFSFPAIIDGGLIVVIFALISLLPNIIYDELSYYTHNLAKALQGDFKELRIQPKIKVPYYKLYLMYIPFQAMILYYLNALIFLSGNMVLLAASILRKLCSRES